VERGTDEVRGLARVELAHDLPHSLAAAEGHGAEAELRDEKAGLAEGVVAHGAGSWVGAGGGRATGGLSSGPVFDDGQRLSVACHKRSRQIATSGGIACAAAARTIRRSVSASTTPAPTMHAHGKSTSARAAEASIPGIAP